MMARFRDAMTLAMKVKLAKLVNARLAEARRVRDGRADQVKASSERSRPFGVSR